MMFGRFKKGNDSVTIRAGKKELMKIIGAKR